ncbi:type II secretion system minor pseudopilin GspK [Yokenella regensburgei]|uniref:type II secretion system minor pseudopilin GspK n=1 Tax=Yokenella regensburgei TaxID=158877 RepID=UPI001432D04E|nr:type II secretion system minor pseudopilin GspK [Yokenella regensburgei]QIU90732.1 type II secretion system minor pseudopilin GspK [Yokenella regensburgei]
MKQRGMALLVVLLLLGLMAGLAADMATRFHTSLRRTGQIETALQQRWDFRIAEDQALRILLQDLKNNPQLNSRDQLWAQPHTLALKDGATVIWQLRSAQDCFNLNALAHSPLQPLEEPPYSVAVFRALLEQSGVSALDANALTAAIADYIDSDNNARRDGAEDDSYSDKPVRYVANQPFFDVSELRAIKGMTPRLYQTLSPWLCALGSSTLQIHVNTLSAVQTPLLAALFLNKQNTGNVRSLLSQTPENGWISPKQLLNAAAQAWPADKDILSKSATGLSATSDFYTLTLRLQHEGRTTLQRSSIYYQRKDSQLSVYARTAAPDSH